MKNNEEELAPHEDIIQLMAEGLECAAEAVTITDLKDRFIYVNEAFCEIYGYSRKEILGQRPTILVPPHAVAEIFPMVTRATRKGGWKGELLNRAKDGRLFPIRLSTAPIRNEKGELKGLIGISEEILERKHSRDAPSKSHPLARMDHESPQEILERHVQVFCSTPHALCMISPEWRICYANPAFSQMLGADEADVLDLTGLDFQDFFPSPEAFQAFQEWARNHVSSAKPATSKIQVRRTDSFPFWCEISVLPAHPTQTHSNLVAILSPIAQPRQANDAGTTSA